LLCDDRAVTASQIAVNRDAAITDANGDRLGRKEFAKHVAGRIAAAGDGSSVVFGLAGAWGSGKSSVLNMVKEALDGAKTSDADDAVVWKVIQFTPWAADDITSLTAEFYAAIAAAMPSNPVGRRARALLTLAPIGVAVGKAAAKSLAEKYLGKGAVDDMADAAVDEIADKLDKFKVEQDPFVLRFKHISEAISRARQNILVIVDDVDRLHSDELLTVMKAVRLLGRFDGVHYLLSFDEETLLGVLSASSLANGNRVRARQYVEKIVQYPFVLPPLQNAYFESQMREALGEVADMYRIDPHQKDAAITDIIDSLPDEDVDTLTIRAIKRLATQTDILLTLAGQGELDFRDAALVTYLRTCYPQVYTKLSQWRDDLLGSPQQGDPVTPEKWHERISGALADRNQNWPEDPEKSARIYAFLKKLFPQLSGDENDNFAPRICDSDYFDRYLVFGIPVKDIPDSGVADEFGLLLRGGEPKPPSLIVDNIGSGLILRKIRRRLGMAAQAESGHAEHAAHFLANRIPRTNLITDGWSPVMYALLARASHGDRPGSTALERFVHVFGRPYTADILAYPISVAGIDDGAINATSNAFRDEVLDICRRDLESDVLAADPQAETILDFTNYLDDGLWQALRECAERMLSGGRVAPYQLAGRFIRVVVPEPGKISLHKPTGSFYLFKKLVAESDWRVDDIPASALTDPVPDDNSLANRIRIAAHRMKNPPKLILRR
jgi:hypothetical protein